MSAVATEVAFDRDEIFKIAVDLEAAASYLHAFFDDDNGVDSKPKERLTEIYQRLLTAAGVLVDGEPVDEPFEQRLFTQGADLGYEWFEQDRELICAAFGRMLARAMANPD